MIWSVSPVALFASRVWPTMACLAATGAGKTRVPGRRWRVIAADGGEGMMGSSPDLIGPACDLAAQPHDGADCYPYIDRVKLSTVVSPGDSE